VPPHFLSWQARSHFHVAYYFAHNWHLRRRIILVLPLGFAADCSVFVGVGSGLDAGVVVDALPWAAVDFFLVLNISSSIESMSCCISTSSDQYNRQFPIAICLPSFTALTLLVGRQEEHLACNNLVQLSVRSEVQMICICSSWCHCHPSISCFRKI